MEHNLKLMRQHLDENKASSYVPLILNICIYNGKEKYIGPTSLLSMYDSPALDECYMPGSFYAINLKNTPYSDLI